MKNPLGLRNKLDLGMENRKSNISILNIYLSDIFLLSVVLKDISNLFCFHNLYLEF